MMGEARAFTLTTVAVAILLSIAGSASAIAVPGGEDDDTTTGERVERVVYDLFGLGEDIGEARCATVSLMSQDAPMNVEPYVAPENVGLGVTGTPAPVQESVIIMAYPAECVAYALGALSPEDQSVHRFLP